MTSERDVERLLDRWFAERPIEVADRVLDEVADRIGRQPQQGAWRVYRRDSNVNSYIKPLLAVAAVIVVAVAGIAYLRQPSDPGVGGAASPTASASPLPTASASPSPAPSAGAVFPQWFTPEPGSGGAGILPPGSHTTRSLRPAFTFSVPERWVNSGDSTGYYGLFPDTPANQAEFARSGDLAHSVAMGPHDSPWFVCQAVEKNRGTAAEMVAAALANEAIAMSKPVDVSIGGLTGKQFDVRLNPDWTGTCPPMPGDPPVNDPGDERTRVTLLDAPGRGVIVIFVGSLHSADHEAFLAEAMPIVESFQFDIVQ